MCSLIMKVQYNFNNNNNLSNITSKVISTKLCTYLIPDLYLIIMTSSYNFIVSLLYTHHITCSPSLIFLILILYSRANEFFF